MKKNYLNDDEIVERFARQLTGSTTLQERVRWLQEQLDGFIEHLGYFSVYIPPSLSKWDFGKRKGIKHKENKNEKN